MRFFLGLALLNDFILFLNSQNNCQKKQGFKDGFARFRAPAPAGRQAGAGLQKAFCVL
jgi:hypothetical protein